MAMSSLEVRWFVQGAPDASVLEVFAEAPLVPDHPAPAGTTEASPWREDTYLVLPTRTDIGLKVRREADAPARWEFKGRSGATTPIEVGDLVPRPLERWTKWSVSAADLPGSLTALVGEDAGAALTVRKRRWLRLVELGPEGPVREHSERRTRIDRGVIVELTEVRVGERSAWTPGLEAFPGDAREERAVATLARGLLGALGGLPGDALCCGYPEWLARLG